MSSQVRHRSETATSEAAAGGVCIGSFPVILDFRGVT
jgi:hypothetical protein